MDDNDKTKFAEIMTGLAEDCSAILTQAGLRIKYEALKNYTIDQVKNAVIKVVKNNVYNKMPTTGTIINAIEWTKDDRVEYQYGLILRAIRELGTYGHPRFKDQITQSLVDNRFGWMKICSINPKDMEFFAKDFKSAYMAAAGETIQGAIGYRKQRDLIDMVKKIGNGP